MLACQTQTPGAGNNVTFSQRSLPYAHSHHAARNGGATDAAAAPVTESVAAAFPQTSTVAGDILARSTRALTSIVQSAASKARELSDVVAAEFNKVAGLPAVDAHHRPGLHLGDPTAWV